MGRRERAKPQRLGEKLLRIREALNLTTEEMIKRLDYPEIPLHRASITEYEKNRREPPSLILLQYARAANVFLEVLIDDSLDLPNKIPSIPSKGKGVGVKRNQKPKTITPKI